MKIIVVGSGPAGISVSKGLLERGFKVIMLDVGNFLESNKIALLDRIQQTQDLSSIYSLRHHANGKKSRKLPYGSDFIYKDINDYFVWTTKNCYFQPSFAQGGLSNVWGGVTDEYSPSDLSEWPFACRDLSIYYSRIISWLGHYYHSDTTPFLSRQAIYLKKNWVDNQIALQKLGFTFRTPTLAVDFNSCRSCGLCQYGCPYGLIYHTSLHLKELIKDPNFTYINNRVVERFSEDNNKIELIFTSRQTKSSERIHADRLFIACGAGLSSLLYLRSLDQPGKELVLKDSQHFMLPCLINKRIKEVMQDSLHTLCQLKMNLTKKTISDYPVQLQIYTYMEFYLQEIRNKIKWLFPVFKPLWKPYMERLVAIQGYLNSKESNQLSITYESKNFFIKKINSRSIPSIIDRIIHYLKNNDNYLALRPLRFLLFQSLVGQSNHVSGSLEMSDIPQGDQTDIWGRPSQFRAIHFVDASILPPMPAGSPTLTIMANAYRIGKEVPL